MHWLYPLLLENLINLLPDLDIAAHLRATEHGIVELSIVAYCASVGSPRYLKKTPTSNQDGIFCRPCIEQLDCFCDILPCLTLFIYLVIIHSHQDEFKEDRDSVDPFSGIIHVL